MLLSFRAFLKFYFSSDFWKVLHLENSVTKTKATKGKTDRCQRKQRKKKRPDHEKRRVCECDNIFQSTMNLWPTGLLQKFIISFAFYLPYKCLKFDLFYSGVLKFRWLTEFMFLETTLKDIERRRLVNGKDFHHRIRETKCSSTKLTNDPDFYWSKNYVWASTEHFAIFEIRYQLIDICGQHIMVDQRSFRLSN